MAPFFHVAMPVAESRSDTEPTDSEIGADVVPEQLGRAAKEAAAHTATSGSIDLVFIPISCSWTFEGIGSATRRRPLATTNKSCSGDESLLRFAAGRAMVLFLRQPLT